METTSRPNLLLIMCDQLRWDYLGCYGKYPWMKTPNIDRIAREGCLCRRAYSPNPVCIPARHNLITGLPAKDHGFDDNYFGPNAKSCPPELPTFAEILSDGGYSTAAIGKMHFQPERRSTGFDLFLNEDEVVKDVAEDEYAQFLIEKGYGNVGSIHGVRNLLYMQPQESLLPEELHGTTWVADRTIEYLKGRKQRTGKPFCLWTGFIHPHPPLDVPPAWAHLYDGLVPPPVDTVTPLSQIAVANQGNAFFPNPAVLNRWRELYACSISFVDHHVGRILDTLKEEGLEENTLVIFVSDHGEMLGDNNTYQKFLAYDGSSRIPFLLRWPGHIEKGSVKEEFVDLNDLFATLIGVGGQTYPGERMLPGENLLEENPKKDRRWQYIEHQKESKRWCALVGKEWKYVHYYGDRDELFHLAVDPEETTNLLEYTLDGEASEVLALMKKELLKREEQWGLPGYVEDGDFKEFPPFRSVGRRRERIFPFTRVMEETDPPLDPITEEILKAIEKEPLVKVKDLEPEDVLLNQGRLTEEELKAFLAKAEQQGN